MSAIIDWFVGLGDFFNSVIDFVVGFFEDLVYVIKLLGEFILQIPGYFAWMPPAILALLMTIFGIVVVYMILNRK